MAMQSLLISYIIVLAQVKSTHFRREWVFNHFCLINSTVCKLCERRMAIIFPFYNISSSNFGVILILARCFQLWR